MQATRVLLLSDGRPGHYRLSEGVVAAVARHMPVDVDRIAIPAPRVLPKAFVPKLARRLPNATALRLLHGISAHRIAPPRLIVSAGGLTLGANAALADLLGAPNVFCGTTRGFSLDRFSLVLTDDPAEGGPENVRVCPKPSAFDPDDLPPPRPLVEGRVPLSVGVLVGGPVESALFTDRDWSELADLIANFATELDAKAIVVTGPRTPETASGILQSAFAAYRQQISFIDFRTAGPGSSQRALATDLVLVTSDSMSMMTEAALSRRPAIALSPRQTAPSRDDAAIAMLKQKDWLAGAALASATPQSLLTQARALAPMKGNHLDSLAEFLLPLLGNE